MTLPIGTWVPSQHWRTSPVGSARALRRASGNALTHVALCLNDNSNRLQAPAWHLFGDGAAQSRDTAAGKVRVVTRRATREGQAAARARVIEAAKAYRDTGFTVELFSWLRPTPAFLAAAREDLTALLAAFAAAGLPRPRIHWDVEEAWSRSSDADFAGFVADFTAHPIPAPQLVTTYAGLLSHRSLRELLVAEPIEGVIVQAYAVEGGKTTAGAVQRYALSAWKTCPASAAGKHLLMGLPAYEQTTALARIQYDASIAISECRELWYWSSASLDNSGPAPSLIRSLGG